MTSNRPLSGVNITLGMLCYNTKELTMEAFGALRSEADALKVLGASVHVALVDNGGDGTHQAYRQEDVEVVCNWGNRGSSHGRNQIIHTACHRKSDYLMLVDGDIRPVGGSAYAMVRYMLDRADLGCLSAHPVRQTCKSEEATQYIGAVHTIQNDITTACTGYAMFDCVMFHEPYNIRLDSSGPFGEPGWGFEDDDLYWQMKGAGWRVEYFTDMVYLQRQSRSSWPNLLKDGVSVKEMFERRKEYFLQKWKQKGLDSAILLNVQAQQMPRDYDEQAILSSTLHDH